MDFYTQISEFDNFAQLLCGFILIAFGLGFFMVSLDKRHLGFMRKISKDGVLKYSSVGLMVLGAALIYQTFSA